jgi:hypothetical protein
MPSADDFARVDRHRWPLKFSFLDESTARTVAEPLTSEDFTWLLGQV